MNAAQAAHVVGAYYPRRLNDLWAAVGEVPDPEIPAVNLNDLGIVRDVRLALDGVAEVVITPTYSGCPATEAIRADVLAVAHEFDPRARVIIELAPAWTTDWITPTGRTKLAEYGIAPPSATRAGPIPIKLGFGRPEADIQVRCPQCGSVDTEVISKFGSTPCKALRRCRGCLEPFDEFKSI